MKTNKNLNLIFFAILSISSFLGGQKTFAQCQFVSVDTSGTAITIVIACDFPVFMDTGDPLADNQNYSTDKSAYVSAHPGDYSAMSAAGNSYFEIHQTDFNAMSPARQTALQQKPNMYHIIP